MDTTAAGDEVSPRTLEADLPTDPRSDDVTMADGLENENTGAFYRHLQPDVSYKIKYRIHPRRMDTTITRLRLGHRMTNPGLHKIGVRDNADCTNCRKPETTEHFLLTCSVQQQLQDELRRVCIRISKPFNIETILTTTSCTDIIYDWTVSSKRLL